MRGGKGQGGHAAMRSGISGPHGEAQTGNTDVDGGGWLDEEEERRWSSRGLAVSELCEPFCSSIQRLDDVGVSEGRSFV